MINKLRVVTNNFMSSSDQIAPIVGTNQKLRIMPESLNFAGFTLDSKTYTLKVSVLNISNEPQRLVINKPSTPFFLIFYNKNGQLAAGMRQDITV
jgi:hypothetical protein